MAGPRSDIYSLGIILYEMVTGAVPFVGKSVFEVMIQRVQRPARPAREINPEIPGYLEKILERCLAMDPEIRYQSIQEILKDLDSGTFHTTMRLSSAQALAMAGRGGIAVVVGLALGGWWRRGRVASGEARPLTSPNRSSSPTSPIRPGTRLRRTLSPPLASPSKAPRF